MSWECIESGRHYGSLASAMAGTGTLIERYGYLIKGGGMHIERTVSDIGRRNS